MRPGVERRFKLRAAYTVAEIAALLSMEIIPARRLLRKLGILRQPGGRGCKLFVYLGDLKRADPALWESMLDAN